MKELTRLKQEYKLSLELLGLLKSISTSIHVSADAIESQERKVKLLKDKIEND